VATTEPYRTPPPGRHLTFGEWTELVVAGVRERVPDVVATRRGRRLVTLRRGSDAMMVEDVGTSWVVWREGVQRRAMLSIGDRRDAFVADNAAASIAGALG
jgi:hypothetical protein